MQKGLEVLLWGLTAVIALPVCVFFAQCVLSLIPGRRKAPAGCDGTGLDVAVLVPAHNEEQGIGATLTRLLPQVQSPGRIVVIADNCTDGTEEVARGFGVSVVARHDPVRRGKGYALEHGVRSLAADPPQAVVVIDADCKVDDGAIARLACRAVTCARPVQSLYLLDPPPTPQGPSARTLVSSLAFTVKNHARPAGMARIGLPCHLRGTGMAFPWALLAGRSLGAGDIVEDMWLGIDLAITGQAPVFCPEARVTGDLPAARGAEASQRRRWEHGHLQTLFSQVPRLVWQSARQGRPELLALALDLCVPPLALLVIQLSLATVMAAVATAWLGASAAPLATLVGAGVLLIGVVLASWARFCRRDLPFAVLLAVPLYVLWKVPLYLSFLVRREQAWVRTARDLPAVGELSAQPA